MRKAMIGLGWVAAMALASTAMAQTVQPSATPKAEAQAQIGLFPPNEPVPQFRTGADNPDVSLSTSGHAPNAGNTGFTGSGSNGRGWDGPAYAPRNQR